MRHRSAMLILTALVCVGATSCSKSDWLVNQFQEQHVFWKQFEVAKAMVASKDPRLLPALEGYLNDEDRHKRANAAYVFAGFHDPRGLDVLESILGDISDRPDAPSLVLMGGGIFLTPKPGEPPPQPSPPQRHTQQQIEQDRYYAAHVLGELGDSGAVPALVSVLNVPSVNMAAIWSLALIGDQRADGPLIDTLSDKDPDVRVLAIQALAKLNAQESIHELCSMLNDKEKSTFDKQISVGDAATAALSHLRAQCPPAA